MATKRQTFRLYPNKEQENKLFEAGRNHAYLYNACVAHRRYEWKANKKSISYFDQQNCLPAFKKGIRSRGYAADTTESSVLIAFGSNEGASCFRRAARQASATSRNLLCNGRQQQVV